MLPGGSIIDSGQTKPLFLHPTIPLDSSSCKCAHCFLSGEAYAVCLFSVAQLAAFFYKWLFWLLHFHELCTTPSI